MTTDNQLTALERLADLKARGMLTDEQYETQKEAILHGNRRGSKWIIIVLAAIVAVAGVAAALIAFVKPAAKPEASASTPVSVATAATVTASPSPTATTLSDPEIPSQRGKTSAADPIAQSLSQAEGMVADKTLNVAGKKVSLYKREGEGLFDSNYVLMVGSKGEVLEEGQLYSISAVGPYVILQSDSGGTACPATFQIVDVAEGRISGSFGTCSDLIKSHVAADGSLISVVHRFNVGGPVTARYSHGALTVWGER